MPAKKTATAGAETERPELALIRSLADILTDTGLTEIELEQKGTRVRVSRSVGISAAVAIPHGVPGAVLPPAPVSATSSTAAATVEASTHPGTVKSPMVGTAYLAAAPGANAFIEEGAEVKQGQTLLIIEAMKTMNQIPAPRGGKIIRIFVANGQPVEYGEPLVVIE